MSFATISHLASLPAMLLASLAIVPMVAAFADQIEDGGLLRHTTYDDMDPSYLLYCHAMF